MTKFIAYLKYFFYISLNWNIKIAWHIVLHEMSGEKKYNINTTGVDELKSLEEKGIDIHHSTIYMPVSYDVLENIFTQISKFATAPINHFVDIGCGKGRALCVAANFNFIKVTGIDFSKQLCICAQENLFATKQKITLLQYKIINNDAFYFEIPDDADCIFMFNPFDEIIMSGVAKNILKSFKRHPRKIIVAYVNPLHKEVLLKIGFEQMYFIKKLNFLEAAILQLKN